MIEIVHLKKGQRTFASVFGLDPTEFYTIKHYKARYTAGLEKPHFPMPACLIHSYELEWQWLILFCRDFMQKDFFGFWRKSSAVIHDPGEPPQPVFDDDHPSTCRCETCRYWGA